MGQKSSRTAPEHIHREEDRHSAWGSDIDDTFCGPRTICADEWTPMHSLSGTPESQRRRFSDIRIEDDVITEQPTSFGLDEDNMTNYDVMTIQEDFEIPPVLVAPMIPRKKKRKIRKNGKLKRKKKIRKRKRRNSYLAETVETPVLRSYRKPRQIRHVQKHNRPRRHHIIHIRRIRAHQDPRYPLIPPPSNNLNLKFRNGHPDDRLRYSKAVPPRHLKGRTTTTKPHFRYRGIPKIIV